MVSEQFKTADIDTFTEEIQARYIPICNIQFYSVDKYDIDGVFTLDAKNIIY